MFIHHRARFAFAALALAGCSLVGGPPGVGPKAGGSAEPKSTASPKTGASVQPKRTAAPVTGGSTEPTSAASPTPAPGQVPARHVETISRHPPIHAYGGPVLLDSAAELEAFAASLGWTRQLDPIAFATERAVAMFNNVPPPACTGERWLFRDEGAAFAFVIEPNPDHKGSRCISGARPSGDYFSIFALARDGKPIAGAKPFASFPAVAPPPTPTPAPALLPNPYVSGDPGQPQPADRVAFFPVAKAGGMGIAPDGTIHVGEVQQIRTIKPDGTASVAPVPGIKGQIIDLALGPNGTPYVVTDGHKNVGGLRVWRAGATPGLVLDAGVLKVGDMIDRLAVTPDGAVLLALVDFGAAPNGVTQVDPDGKVRDLNLLGYPNTRLEVSIDREGRPLVLAENEVLRLNADGKWESLVKLALAPEVGFSGFAVDASGRVLIGSTSHDGPGGSGSRIYRLNPAGGTPEILAGPGGKVLNGKSVLESVANIPGTLAFDAAGNLYILDNQRNGVMRVPAASIL